MQESTALSPSVNTKTSAATKILFVLLWVDSLFKWLYFGLYYPWVSPNADYSKHWDAAHALVNGTTPYFETPPLGYTYPLFISLPYLWMGFLTIDTARVAWILCNFFHITCGAYLLGRLLKPKNFTPVTGEASLVTRLRRGAVDNWGTVTVVILANYKPLMSALLPANVEPANFLFYSIFTVAMLKHRSVITALSWVCFTLVKIVPVILLMPMFLTRKFKELSIYLFVLLSYVSLLFISGYWKIEADLYRLWLPRLGHYFESINYSTGRTIGLLLGKDVMAADYLAYNRWVLGVNIILGTIITLTCLAWRRWGKGSSDLLIGFVMLCLPLLSPILEYIHFVWGVPLVFFQLRAWVEGRIPPLQALALLFGWLSLMTVYHLSTFAQNPFGFSWLFLSSPVGLLLAAISAWVAFTASGRDWENKTS